VASRAYYTLIASLPNLPPHFDVERTPITRPRLAERLKMLHPQDAEVVEQVAAFLAWDRQPLDRTDQEVLATYNKLMAEISNPLLRELVESRMDTRTISSGLRRRRAGLPPPPGVGKWVNHIRRHYNHPEFNLQGRYPWIGHFDRLMDAGDAMGAQRLLFDVNYALWSRMAEQYTFSFEAVILYLARWEIIDRWTSRDADRGRARFEQLITETLGDYAHLF
jgi:hypothetical protein